MKLKRALSGVLIIALLCSDASLTAFAQGIVSNESTDATGSVGSEIDVNSVESAISDEPWAVTYEPVVSDNAEEISTPEALQEVLDAIGEDVYADELWKSCVDETVYDETYNALSDEEKTVWDELYKACIAVIKSDVDLPEVTYQVEAHYGEETHETEAKVALLPEVSVDEFFVAGTWTDEDLKEFITNFEAANPQFYFLNSGYTKYSNNTIRLWVYDEFSTGAVRTVVTEELQEKKEVQNQTAEANPEFVINSETAFSILKEKNLSDEEEDASSGESNSDSNSASDDITNTDTKGSGDASDNTSTDTTNINTNTTTVPALGNGNATTYGHISYDLDDGEWDTVNSTAGSTTATADAVLTLPVPKKDGSVFLGWYVNDSRTSSVVKSSQWRDFATATADGAVTIDVPSLVEGKTEEERNEIFTDLTFYAKWGEGKIVYESNYNSTALEDSIVTQELSAEQIADDAQKNVILKEDIYRKSGYTFVGWNTKTDGTGTTYASKEEILWATLKAQADADLGVGSNASTNSVTLYATWSIDGLTITYDADGGTFNINNEEKQTVTSDAILSGNTYYMPGSTVAKAFDTSNTTLSATLSSPKRPGYTLAYWSTQKNGAGSKYKLDKAYSNTQAAGATKTLYAVWKANAYNLTYDLDGGVNNGKNIATFTAGATSQITLYNPTRSGYVFTGWDSTDPALKTKLDELEAARGTNTTITLPVETWRTAGFLETLQTKQTLPLKATWRKATYTVAFNLNVPAAEAGTTSFIEAAFVNQLTPDANGKATCTYNETYLAPVPKRAGYTFAGWGTNARTAIYKPGANGTISFKNLSVTDGATITLYAIWIAKSQKAAAYTYNVTYDLNDAATGNPEFAASFATGYYADNTDDAHVITKENDANKSNITVDYDAGVTYTTPIPKRNGYTFTGWSLTATGDATYKATNTGTTTVSNVAKTKEEGDASKDAPIVLYASWKRTDYAVSYELNGGTKGANSPIAFKVPEDGDVPEITTINVPQPTKRHAIFEGWYLDDEYTQKLIDETYATTNQDGATEITIKDLVKTGSLEDDATLTLYAKFRANQYEIAFEVDPTENETFTDATLTENAATLTLNDAKDKLSGVYSYGTKYSAPIATKPGYVLKGWKNTATGRSYRFNYKGNLFFKNLSTLDYTQAGSEAITFEPIWALRSYEIEYVTSVGRNSFRNPKTFMATDEEDEITIYGLSAIGYDFTGWDANIEFEDASQESIITKDATEGTLTIKTKELIATGLLDETGTLTLVADWNPHHYTIIYDGNGGSMASSKDYLAYGTAYKLPDTNDVKRAGYTLTGWSRTKAGGRDFKPGDSVRNLTSKDGDTITLYADWKKTGANKFLTMTSCEAVGKNIGDVVMGTSAGNENPTVDYDIEIKALAQAYTSVTDDTYYLVAVNQNTQAIEYVFPQVNSNDDAKAGRATYGLTIEEIPEDTTLTFDLDLINTTRDGGYYKQVKAKQIQNGKETGREVYIRAVLNCYGIAEKDASGTYKLISDVKYVSHPENIAYTNSFEKGATKKGIQGASYLLESGDTNDLQVDHVFLNIYASQVIRSGPASSGNYEYNGKWYTFQNPALSTIKACNDRIMATDPDGTKHSVSVTVQVMLDWNNVTAKMVNSKARSGGHFLYSWENNQQEGREMIEAMFSFLGESCGKMNWITPAYVSNWILGNEVNSYRVYQYSGSMSTNDFYLSYAETFRTAYNAIKASNGSARVYACADQCWNSPDAGYTSKYFLDNFNAYMKRLDPTVDWNIAFHPYAHPLMATNFWTNDGVTNSVSTPYITMKNISVLTNYATTTLRHADGTVPRIILSELGYSRNNGNQAAALAYSYAIAAHNPNIDAIMIRSLVDEAAEAGMGFGISRAGKDNTIVPFDGYYAYKYITEDDDASKAQMNSRALWKKISSVATGWASLIKDFIESCLFTNNSQ